MRLAWLLLLASAAGSALLAAPALAFPERPMHAGIMGGVRAFNVYAGADSTFDLVVDVPVP